MGQEISTEDAEKTLTAEKLLEKIKSNQPEELTSENDFLGTIPKGDMIKGFLESLLNRPVIKDKPDIQMIALYGEWGSGKTSLMQYVKSQLDAKNSFKTIFFPAWEMEKDDNLSLSLLEAIIESEKGLDKTDIKDALLAIGKGIGKGLSAKIGPINLNFKEVIQSVEDYNTSLTEDSSLKRIQSFQEKYRDLEVAVLNKSKKEKLIVFIDDLDRCEPENVLDLLSVIKSFFKLGNQTVFICGFDEKAVDEAVKVKYNKVVKSGEYMEKIFDISFEMPKPNINKMIRYYFKALPEFDHLTESEDIFEVINFFITMQFLNPRHLKKVLNQYLLLRYYQETIEKKSGCIPLIPDQNVKLFKYLTLFIIILYKFNKKEFNWLKDQKLKTAYFKNLTSVSENMSNPKTDRTSDEIVFLIDDADNKTINKLYEEVLNKFKDSKISKHIAVDEMYRRFIITFFAPKIKQYHMFSTFQEYVQQFINQKNYTAFWCQFIFEHKELIEVNQLTKEKQFDNAYILCNIFKMAELYL